MDAQARLGSVAGLAALVHGLAIARARRPRRTRPPPGAGSSRLVPRGPRRARRDDCWGGAMRPLRDVAAEAIAIARGTLRERGADGALEEVERILREGNGADRMRAAYARAGCRGARAARRGRGSGRLRRARRASGEHESPRTGDDAPTTSAITCAAPALGDAERDRVVERVQHHARDQRARLPVDDAQQRAEHDERDQDDHVGEPGSG